MIGVVLTMTVQKTAYSEQVSPHNEPPRFTPEARGSQFTVQRAAVSTRPK
jgi:hypothetical protein